jgi:dTDP-3-amino-2,3,6-trideoxy-4-keto-D-glucose/dTDP-3-amino-3,4,6-trideoxy-alpha-D-glucose/dTDP-2,6-dideoxy-D-kanosamine transaminase
MTKLENFLPVQYETTGALPINHNYLTEQFADRDEILAKIREVVVRGDFTLGRAVDEFEEQYAELTQTKHAIGVGSGTDALFLSLKAIGVKDGDEVITTPYTFYATIGAIVTAGARPVFVDVQDDYNIDPGRIEAAITQNTRAILPVHWSGKPCRMHEIMEIAERRGLEVVEDSCHGIKASLDGKAAGSFGISGCFSMHPLKNLNVWGDGGVAVTNSDEFARKLRLLRNHGLMNRDECAVFAYNSRLDTVQAVVASHLLKKIDHITEARIANATYFDAALRTIPQITVPVREANIRQVFHIYCIRAERRQDLQAFLVKHGVDAKVHYPIPMHLQPAATPYGYKRGDFPMAEAICDSVLSLPVHEFITRDHQDRVIDLVRRFYA